MYRRIARARATAQTPHNQTQIMTNNSPIDNALKNMMRAGGEVAFYVGAAQEGEPLFLVKPFVDNAQVIVLLKKTADDLIAGPTYQMPVYRAQDTIDWTAAERRDQIDCIVCGKPAGAGIVFAALSAKNCVRKATSVVSDAPTAWLFAHCVGCRDEAHWRASAVVSSNFKPRGPTDIPIDAKFSMHVSYETLCAGMHRKQLRDMFRHPYTHAKLDATFVVDHKNLPMYERRCAARECGKFFVHGTEYKISRLEPHSNGKTVLSLTTLHCVDSSRCSESALRDLTAILRGDLGIAQVPVERVATDSKVVPLHQQECAACFAPGKLFYCAGCRGVLYCSRTCQRAKWSEHRQMCAIIRDRVARAKASAN